MDRTEKILAGDVRVASRLIRDIEDGFADAVDMLKELYPYTGKAHVIGITGSPGAGKSTLTDGIIEEYRRQQKTVGVLAVDPTSPFSGGAILGDRVRMQRHTEDPGVFVRSLATRGALGGLSIAVGDSIHVLDSMGKDRIIVETVGIGQQEVDIMNHAHTILVVLVPGMGDGVQAIKAGVMEIADIFIINKADRDGADVLYNEINLMLDMAYQSGSKAAWRPPVIKVGNVNDAPVFMQGIKDLVASVDRHYQFLVGAGGLDERRHRQALCEVMDALKARVLGPIYTQLNGEGALKTMIDEVVSRRMDPHSLADVLARKYLKD